MENNLELASERGTSVHTICEKYLDNDPDYLDGVIYE